MVVEISLQIETNEALKKIDLYCCALKVLISEKLVTVGHIPRQVSRRVFFFIADEGRVLRWFCVVNTLPSLVHP